MNTNSGNHSDRTAPSRDNSRKLRRVARIGQGPERLEGRELLATDVWTGITPAWTSPSNWSGNIVPVSGDDILLGAAGTSHSATLPDDFTASSITVQSDFTLSGTLNVAGSIPINVVPGATLNLNGIKLQGNGSLTKLGNGTIVLSPGDASQASAVTLEENAGTVTLGSSGTVPITIKVASGAKLNVGPTASFAPVKVTGTKISGASSASAGIIEITAGSTFAPANVINGFFSTDAGSTFAPNQINGGYFIQQAADSITTNVANNGTFTLKPGGSLSTKTAEFASTFTDGLPAGQSTPNDFTVTINPDAGTTGTFGSAIAGGGKFVTAGGGNVVLASGIKTNGALQAASFTQTGDTVFSAASTTLATPIEIANSPSISITANASLDVVSSTLSADKAAVSFNQNSTFKVRIDAAANGQLVAGGTVALNNATLSVLPSFVPAAGSTFTILKTTGSSPITGQFAGLAQGATFVANGVPFQINYSAKAITLTSLSQATGTTLSGPSGNFKPGDAVTFTASVNGTIGTPTGTVTFLDGTTSLGSAALVNGVATFTTTALTGGNHSITASYGGDASFNSSKSNAVSQAIRPSATNLSLQESSSSSTIGQGVTLTVNASNVLATPTGNVTFLDGQTTIGTSTLDGSGKASLTIDSLSIGSHLLSVSYNGDTNSNAATSTTQTLVVSPIATTVTLDSTASSAQFGQIVTVGATVKATQSSGFGTPTGQVVFVQGNAAVGLANLDSSGHASLPIKLSSVGTNQITANYVGDAHFATSTAGNPVTTTVASATTSTSLTITPDTPVVGRQMLFTATVYSAGGTPTGNVIFSNGSKQIGKIALTGGQAFLVTTLNFTPGQSITATYVGSNNYTSSTSSPVVLTPPTTVVPPTTTPVVSVPKTPTPSTPIIKLPTPISSGKPNPIPSTPKHPLFGHKPAKRGHGPKIVVRRAPKHY
jgi:hypothetical protein